MIDRATPSLLGSERQIARLYSMHLSMLPLVLYASAALPCPIVLVLSTARICSEYLMIESGEPFALKNAVSRQRRPSVEFGYAVIAARPLTMAASYFAARRSFSHCLY